MLKLGKNEKKILLMSYNATKKIIYLISLHSAIINVKIGNKKVSPEFSRAVENLKRRNMINFDNLKTNNESVIECIYSLTPLGQLKAKSIATDQKIKNKKS